MLEVTDRFLNWIKEGTDRIDFSADWKGNLVSHCIPKRYSAYCKIMHPMRRDRKIIDERLLWSETGESVPHEFDMGEKITYKALAQKYHLNYTKEISTHTFLRHFGGSLPRYLIAPDEGEMECSLVKEMMDILKPFTEENKVYFCYSLLKVIQWKQDDLVYCGNLEDVLTLCTKEELNGSPTYWWPEDKSWCVCTDYDLDFTLVGGSEELIHRFLSNRELESIEVESHTRIDYRADENNLPHNK